MNIYTRSLGIFVSSLFFLLQTQALWAQGSAGPRSTATTAVAAEPQAAGQIVSASSQVIPALPVPRLIKFSGVSKDVSGQPRSGVVGILFSVYANQEGGTALWMETQNVELDAHGHYAVLLGSSQSAGMPLDLFTTGEPRWLGAKVELPGEVEQPRVLLVSVPYALKASDADTVGGMPASAFVLAPSESGSGAGAAGAPGAKSKTAKSGVKSATTCTSCLQNWVPLFTDTSGDVTNSVISQTTGHVAIGTAVAGAQNALLVVGNGGGGAMFNGSNDVDTDFFVTLSAPHANPPVSTFGPMVPSNLALQVGGQPKLWITNSGNVGIGTTTPAATLEVNGTTQFDGLVNFAGAQTFPGTGTITGVSGTNGITGGGSSGSVTLGLATATCPSGTALIALPGTCEGFASSLANTFYGNQTVNGNVTATQIVSGGVVNATTSFDLGGTVFAFGSSSTANAFLGFAGNTTTTGNLNTASGWGAFAKNTSGGADTANGYYALLNNTQGNYNTATGNSALVFNTTGNDNTAVGYDALYTNSAGNENTAVGADALYSATGSNLTCIGFDCTVSADGLSNATAIGAHAVVGASNTLVLGGTGQYAVKVGIGTPTPSNVLTIAQGAGQPLSDGWATFSSRRWKTNIQTLHDALAKIEQLRGVSYDLKANGQHEVGVIAEEVGAVVPEVVTWEKNGKDAQSVDYGRLTALLIEATKEQQALIQRQQEQIKVQQEQIVRLTRQVKTIQATLKANGRSGSEVRTVKAEATTVRQQ